MSTSIDLTITPDQSWIDFWRRFAVRDRQRKWDKLYAEFQDSLDDIEDEQQTPELERRLAKKEELTQ